MKISVLKVREPVVKAGQPKKIEYPLLSFASQADWELWLEDNHAASNGVRLEIAKKGSGVASVTYTEAVETALCYGWIDGQANSIDAQFYAQKFTPRRKGSIWSKVNREKALALIESGRMRPAGLEAIERAKAGGQWQAAYDSPSQAAPPPDLQAELDKNPAAQAFFATLGSRNRYAILHRLQTTRTPETRARRLAQFVEMLARNEKLYPDET